MALLRSLDDQIRISIKEGDTFMVGRIPECEVVLEDGSVSSQHARVQLKKQVLHVQDLGSTNGTRVNYAQVDAPTLLLDGDIIEFGNVTFTVDAPELCSPEDIGEVTVDAVTKLERVVRSGNPEHTIPIQGLDDVEVDHQDHLHTNTTETQAGNPVTAAFAISLLLLLIGGGVLLYSLSGLASAF